MLIGPELPKKSDSKTRRAPDPEQTDSATENQLQNQEYYGPVIPPDLLQEEDTNDTRTSVSNSDSGRDSDDDCVAGAPVGPMLPPVSGLASTSEDYELRLAKLRKQQLEAKQKREEWMTQLPAKLQNYGLGARTFSKRGVESSDADHSAWTDTPADKLRKAEEGRAGPEEKEVASKAQKERDTDLESRALELDKSRTTSLMEMHQKKRKADIDAQGVSAAKERRPFDRETDLNLTKLKAGGTKKMVETATNLGSKFSHGKSQKYL